MFIRLLVIVMVVMSEAELQDTTSGNQKTCSAVLHTSSKIDELRSIVSNYLVLINIELRNTKHQVEELKVAVTENQESVSSDHEIVTSELRNTARQLEDARSHMEELQGAVSGTQETVSLELEDTRRNMDELQVAVSGNLRHTRSKVDELEVAISENQETVTLELRNTRRQMENTRRQMEELQVSVTGYQAIVSTEREDTRRKVDELQLAVSDNLETVSSELGDTRREVEDLQVEVRDMKQHLVQLQVSVSTIVSLLKATSNFPKDCSEILTRGVSMSGMYTVQPLDSGQAFQVYCDMETDGGGWTVFQRRQDGSVDFFLDFASYSRGFGDLEGEFWLGNDNLHRLTAQGEYELRVDLSDFENMTAYAVYDSFSIADVSDNYRLTVGGYSGTAGDALKWHNNEAFTTKDRDNDNHDRLHCAEFRHGAWWFKQCALVHLNGVYFNRSTGHIHGIRWDGFSNRRSLKTTEMKIRSKA